MWAALKNYTDAALLFLRVTLGGFILYVYGWPKLAGGLPRWKAMGAAMQDIGIYFAPGFWGFLAATTASLGSVFLILGFAFRPTCLMFYLTLAVAAVSEYNGRGTYERFLNASHAIELALVFFTLMFIGPGRLSVDKG
jgi:putative oxidoreductase